MNKMYIEVSGDEMMLTIPHNDQFISIHVIFTELSYSQKRIVTFRTSLDERAWTLLAQKCIQLSTETF